MPFPEARCWEHGRLIHVGILNWTARSIEMSERGLKWVLCIDVVSVQGALIQVPLLKGSRLIGLARDFLGEPLDLAKVHVLTLLC